MGDPAPHHLVPSRSGRAEGTCRGERPDEVVEAGDIVDLPSTESQVVLVLGPAQVTTWGPGDDLICVHGPSDGYAGSTLHLLGGGNDTILTLGGANHVFTGDGDDIILSNGPDAILDGEGGDDHVYAAVTVGATFGGEGADLVHAGDGADYVHGGDGPDVLWGGAGDDTMIGGAGNDRIYGEAGFDSLEGASGVDHCVDHSGADGGTFSGCEDEVTLSSAAVGFAWG